MSREIKFRAWYKDGYIKQISIKNEENMYFSPYDLFQIEPEIRRDVVLEQYAGLKDKNGIEIYEGDIVALLFGYVPMKSVTTENIRIENAQKAVIHFDTARASFRYTIKQRTPKDCQFKPGTRTNMVVIGNIHENPELLEETK